MGLNNLVMALEAATTAGTSMVFGYLGGGPLPFEASAPANLYILAFRALPLVLVISALSALLFYWKVLPWVVRAFARALTGTLRIGGAEGLGVAANVFVGMVESPLFIRPYLKQMTRSELFTLMTAGMATIAGTVMVLYASILGERIPGVMGHILVASLISVPAAVTIAKIMIPETGPVTRGELAATEEARSSMDAITRGTIQGVQLLVNIIAMLVVLVALVHLINIMLGLLPDWRGDALTLQRIFGWLLAPLTWLIGIPWPGSPHRRDLAGHQNRAQRAGRLPGHEPAAPGGVERTQCAHYDLCLVRIRQPRFAGHHDRRHGHHGSRTARRNRRPGAARNRGRHPGHLHDRRRGGDHPFIAEGPWFPGTPPGRTCRTRVRGPIA
jgi:concentrative nucleoside transporter, CNT family